MKIEIKNLHSTRVNNTPTDFAEVHIEGQHVFNLTSDFRGLDMTNVLLGGKELIRQAEDFYRIENEGLALSFQVNRLLQEAKEAVAFPKGAETTFLDYTIRNCTNNDGIVLRKEKGKGYETHLGNYGSLDDAKMAAIVYFMLARPERFAATLYYRVMGRGGSYYEFGHIKAACKDEGLELPAEITPIDATNYLIGYKGRKISFRNENTTADSYV